MSLTFPKRAYAGAAVAGTLAAPGLSAVDGAGVTFSSSTALTGWNDVSGANFSGAYVVVTFEYGTANEEKVLCTFNQGTGVFTIVQRAYDGTIAVAHTGGLSGVGALFINTFTATEAAELNAVTQSMVTILTNGGTVTTPQPISVGTGTGSIGTAPHPAAIDHDHKIAPATLNGWLTTTAAGTLASGLSIPYSQVTGTLTISVQPGGASAATTAQPTISTSTGTTTLFTGVVNPNGAFTNYQWTAKTNQFSAASAGTPEVSLVLLYRVAGSGGAWTAGQTLSAGVVTTTNTFATLVATGTFTAPVASTDYEFNLAAVTTSGTVQISRTQLSVIGLN